MRPIHKRKVIRDQVQNILLNNTIAQDRVFKNRMLVLKPADFPLINIRAIEESSELHSSISVYKKTLILLVDCYAKNTSESDAVDQLDLIAQKVEGTISLNNHLGYVMSQGNREVVCEQSELISTNLDLSVEGETLIGLLSLRYNIIYLDSPSEYVEQSTITPLTRISVETTNTEKKAVLNSEIDYNNLEDGN